MIEAYTHHALTPMKQAFDDSRWLRQTRDKRPFGIRKPLLYPTELREPAATYFSLRTAASQSDCPQGRRVLPTRVIWLRVLLVIGFPFMTGCGTVSYYAQAARGQAELIWKRQRIEAVLADSGQSETLKARLRLVNALRQFADEELDLPPGDSYTHYVALDRPMALWVVNAAPEFSLELKSWWYPFVGRFEGRGFFNKQQAGDLADELRGQGYDVVVSGAPAYSTLGWFADPVLSTFVNFNDADLAELIFHELTHQRLYISGDTAFNESFATATAQVATLRWLGASGDGGARDEYTASVKRLTRITRKLCATREKLGVLYSKPLENAAMMRKLKASAFRNLRAELEIFQNEAGFSGAKKRPRIPMNNATLGSVAVYHKHVPAFRKLFENCNHRFPDYFIAVGRLGELPRGERQRALKELRLAAP